MRGADGLQSSVQCDGVVLRLSLFLGEVWVRVAGAMGFVSALTAEFIIVKERDCDARQVCTRQCHAVFKGFASTDCTGSSGLAATGWLDGCSAADALIDKSS